MVFWCNCHFLHTLMTVSYTHLGRKPKKTCKEMTEIEHILEENERLRTEVAYLKKLRELRLRDEALQRKRWKQLENWSQEDFD